MPNHDDCLAVGAAHGTMQGRGVLFPESGLELTAASFTLLLEGSNLGSQVAGGGGDRGACHVAVL